MASLIIILRLLPVIIGAVQAVEAAIPVQSSGKAKLDLVLGTVSDVYISSQQSGQELPVDRLMAYLTQTITRVVATFNALGMFQKVA